MSEYKALFHFFFFKNFAFFFVRVFYIIRYKIKNKKPHNQPRLS